MFGKLGSALKQAGSEAWESSVDAIIDPLNEQFKFKLHQDHSISKKVDKSKDFNEIAYDVIHVYHDRFELFESHLEKINYFFPLSFLLIIFSAYFYLKNYLSSDSYKNYVFTPKFHEIDENRLKKDRATVLPLVDNLRYKYVDLFDVFLSGKEASKTLYSLVYSLISMMPIIFLLCTDQLLMFINETVANSTLIEINIPGSNPVDPKITGNRFMTSVYKNIFHSVKYIHHGNVTLSNAECLPIVANQSYEAYHMIFVYILLVFMLSGFGAYFTRWRAGIAGCFFPERDKERATWLYNHLMSLDSFKRKPKGNLKKIRTGFNIYVGYFIDFSEALFKKVSYILANLIFQSFFYSLCCYCFCLIKRRSLKIWYIENEDSFKILLSKVNIFIDFKENFSLRLRKNNAIREM